MNTVLYKHIGAFSVLTLTALLLPVMASAQDGFTKGEVGGFGTLVANATELINDYLIPFMIALAVLGFIYGVFLFFIMGSSDEEKRAQGRSLMLYALIGFVAIVALWGIVNFLIDAFGFGDQTDQGQKLKAPGGPGIGG